MKRPVIFGALALAVGTSTLVATTAWSSAGADERSGKIGNRTFVDTNRNGKRDAGEPGLAGVTILLTTLDGRPLVKGVSADGGWWGITGLNTNECYRLSFDGPNGYTSTIAGTPGVDNESSADDGGIVNRDICPTTAPQDFWDAGFVADANEPPPTTAPPATTLPPVTVPPVVGTGKIGHRAFLDTNRNGIHDPGEKGVEGVGIRLSNADGTPRIVGKTAAGGWWGIGNLPNGCYQLAFSIPVGMVSTTDMTSPGPMPDRDLSYTWPDGRTIWPPCPAGNTDNRFNIGLAPDPNAPADLGPTGEGTMLVQLRFRDAPFHTEVTLSNVDGIHPEGLVVRSGSSNGGWFFAGNLPADVECWKVQLSTIYEPRVPRFKEVCGTGAHRTARWDYVIGADG